MESRARELTFAFSMLFFGNLVDNWRANQKTILVSLQAGFGIICLIQAGILKAFISDDIDPGRIYLSKTLIHSLDYTQQFLGSGIFLIILLQVFNWFPARVIH